MIYRRYTTLLLLLVALSLGWTLLQAGSFLTNPTVWRGVPQGNGANYPLQSQDRGLVNLDGTWQSFNSLQAAANSSSSVESAVYGSVGAAVYGKVDPKKGLPVPGSWQTAVVVKQFFLSNDLAGQQFRLQFLSLGNDAQVFINGFSAAYSLGQISAGNVPISLDIPTPRLKFGQINTIAISMKQRVSNGPWLVFPGLTGDVYLQAVGTINMASPRITTRLDAEGADLNYQIPYQSSLQSGTLTSDLSLFDAAGHEVAASTHTFPGAGTGTLSGQLVVPQPHLWSTAAPYLYKLKVTLTGAGGERDSYSLPIGLRQISFQGKKLLLNGAELVPKILLRASDAPVSGGAANPVIVDRDLAWAKAQGYNILLLPDHTPEPYMWDAADRQGILLLSDVGAVGLPGDRSLNQRLVQAKTVQVMFGYHPSFLAQGIGDELDLQNPAVQDYLRQAQGIGLTFYSTMNKPNSLLFPGGWKLEGPWPYLADFLTAKPSFQGMDSFTASHISSVGILDRQRNPKKGQNLVPRPSLPGWLFWLLALVAVVLLLQSWSRGNLRYVDLLQTKPKRKLRLIIKQQLYWLILRWACLALIASALAARFGSLPAVDYMVEQIPWPNLQGLLWYLLANPLELSLTVFGLGITLAWLTSLPRARALPGKPSCTAVMLWLEKRKRWLLPALGLWLWACNGGPYWPFWLAVGMGLLLSAWLVGKDLQKSGGKAYSLAYLVGIMLLAAILIGCNWETVRYLYHWSKV